MQARIRLKHGGSQARMRKAWIAIDGEPASQTHYEHHERSDHEHLRISARYQHWRIQVDMKIWSRNSSGHSPRLIIRHFLSGDFTYAIRFRLTEQLYACDSSLAETSSTQCSLPRVARRWKLRIVPASSHAHMDIVYPDFCRWSDCR
jgi:hypothetical protein